MKQPAKSKSQKQSKAAALSLQTREDHKLPLSAWKATLADLTPGLAHDFNNVLTAILAVSEACLVQIDAAHPCHEGFSLIKQKVREASQLNHRIVRLHQETPGLCDYQDLNSLLPEVVEILSRVLPRCIEVSAKYSGDSLPVFIDAVELRRLLLHVAFSAVRGGADRGKLHFQTSRHEALPVRKVLRGKEPRVPAACLSIATSGEGFSAQTLKQLLQGSPLSNPSLEPLRLGFHHGQQFAGQSRGAISVESKPGTGTTFCLWLPEADFTEAEQPG